ncbi:hypothetical protein KP509_37G059100 [Ceratopteris richardii]|uniref:OPA3-like protein n=1 Tax=Ceratopteris richardii TaxID=49495 RepID=A0A8T2Q897_CERRI|nr:hypothetical protein KP509_37G059100 [Ceratopteris richardii]
MILPFAKLGTLAIRTLSKPLASRLKAQAARHERFRNLIERFAQANHKFTVNIQRRIYGHATNVEIKPLDPEKAVQAAADLLGELVIFSVGVAAVLFEVQRSARSEARKEEARRQELEAIQERLQLLEDSFEKFVKGQASSSWLPFKHAQPQKPELSQK